MSSELTLTMSDAEAKKLWSFLNSRYAEMDGSLTDLTRRIESMLWDCLSIDDLANLTTGDLEDRG